jgi:hypothetical protein
MSVSLADTLDTFLLRMTNDETSEARVLTFTSSFAFLCALIREPFVKNKKRHFICSCYSPSWVLTVVLPHKMLLTGDLES